MEGFYKNIVVLGAGYGGLTAALRLSRLFRNSYHIKIHLVDKNPYHTLKTQLHEAAVHKYEVVLPIERIISGRNITFHCGTITKIDLENKKVVIEDKEIEFIYIVIALGSKSNFYNIEGLSDFSFPLQSYEDAEKIYNHISVLCAKASSEQDKQKRKEELTFVVGGGGLSGVEFATELSEHINRCMTKYSLDKNELSILLIEASNRILPSVSDSIRERIEEKLLSKNISLLTNTSIIRVTKDEIFLSDSKPIKSKTIIWTGGIRISGLIKESGFRTGSLGRIIVDEFLKAKDYPFVYALGDNALAINPYTGLPVPAAAQFALQQGRLVAQNIFSDIYGSQKVGYQPKVLGEFISLGRHLAAGWLALPFSKRIGFIGFLASLLNTAIKEKHIFLLKKESRNWISM